MSITYTVKKQNFIDRLLLGSEKNGSRRYKKRNKIKKAAINSCFPN